MKTTKSNERGILLIKHTEMLGPHKEMLCRGVHFSNKINVPQIFTVSNIHVRDNTHQVPPNAFSCTFEVIEGDQAFGCLQVKVCEFIGLHEALRDGILYVVLIAAL